MTIWNFEKLCGNPGYRNSETKVWVSATDMLNRHPELRQDRAAVRRGILEQWEWQRKESGRLISVYALRILELSDLMKNEAEIERAVNAVCGAPE